jgi:hypothetical protein
MTHEPEELSVLIEQLADPACGDVGGIEKSGDNEFAIRGLFEQYGYTINDEGYAAPIRCDED